MPINTAGMEPTNKFTNSCISTFLYALAEGWARSIKEEYLNHLIPFGEGSLRRAVGEYAEFYNSDRPHQGLDSRLLSQDAVIRTGKTEIKVKSRLGGLMSFYYR